MVSVGMKIKKKAADTTKETIHNNPVSIINPEMI
jgi:hypothetical protein